MSVYAGAYGRNYLEASFRMFDCFGAVRRIFSRRGHGVHCVLSQGSAAMPPWYVQNHAMVYENSLSFSGAI